MHPIGNLVNSMTTEVTSCVLGIMAPLELIVYLIMAIGYLSIMFFFIRKYDLYFIYYFDYCWINSFLLDF